MMLNKSMIWIFSTQTLKAMIAELDFHFEEIKSDPTRPPYLTLAHQLADLCRGVLAEKEGSRRSGGPVLGPPFSSPPDID